MAKTKLWFVILSNTFLILFSSHLDAQFHDRPDRGGKPDPQLSQRDNDFIDRQDALFLDSVQSILSAYPPAPALQEARERSWAKLLMDAVFHDHFVAFRKPAQQFYHRRIGAAIQELENTRVNDGARIWKIYNMGFIVRTKSVTIAFDLVSGSTSESEDFALDENEMRRLVSQCDVLFISHQHEDHAEKSVAQAFIAQGKPVVATEQTWPDDPVFDQITHLERVAWRTQKLKLKNNTLDVVIFPGHQMRSAENNVALVTTPEGITMAHLGDEINEGDFMIDFDWMDKVSEKYEVDIMMPTAWTTDIFRIVKGFDPKLVLPGHELELGHTVWDRLRFWGDEKYLGLNYGELKKSKYPVAVMVWGEAYDYRKK